MIFLKYYKYIYPYDSDNAKLGINWYRHHKDHKYKAFTILFLIPTGQFDICFVWKNIAEFKRSYNK